MLHFKDVSPGANDLRPIANDGITLNAANGELRTGELPNDSHWQRLQKLNALNERWRVVCERMVARQ